MKPAIRQSLECLLSVWAELGSMQEWWHRAAIAAVARKRFVPIPSRDGNSLYLLRCWLTLPVLTMDDEGKPEVESGESVLLHYFEQGDDDQALHDHPWDFTTDLLAGSYVEHLPPLDWKPCSVLGPAWDDCTQKHHSGDRVIHQAEDLHCVGRVEPGTFTLVRTGRRRRRWGFHPHNQRWMDAKDFLAQANRPSAKELASATA